MLPILQNFIKNTENDWNYITPVAYYNDFLGKNNHILIDLRHKKDFDKFHIKNAINIFWLDLLKKENLNKIPKNQKIFLICYLGHTSSQALVLLKLLGYDVTSIKFGYGKSPVFGVPVAGWLSWNFPVEPKCDF
jgi:rhodanese-related sulfurtransferase